MYAGYAVMYVDITPDQHAREALSEHDAGRAAEIGGHLHGATVKQQCNGGVTIV
jgi:hypothetical protein